MMQNATKAVVIKEHVFPCVVPGWDNSARKRQNSTVLQNNDPEIYGKWLRQAIGRVAGRSEDKRLVFINAWNEWAEGCYLEPDQRHGRSFLEATARELAMSP